MKRSQLIKYEGRSVRIKYKNEIAPQKRTGIIYAVTMKVVIFWPFEHDKEIQILFKDVKDVKEL